MSSVLLPQLLLGIARSGYRGPIKERALSSLLAWADERGLEEILEWVVDDSGLLFMPSWQFPMGWKMEFSDLVPSQKERERRWSRLLEAVKVMELGKDGG